MADAKNGLEDISSPSEAVSRQSSVSESVKSSMSTESLKSQRTHKSTHSVKESGKARKPVNWPLGSHTYWAQTPFLGLSLQSLSILHGQ